MSASKPLTKHREVLNDAETGWSSTAGIESGRCLITDPDGVRCTDGMNLVLVLIRNVRTYQVVPKGKVQAAELTRTKVPMRLGRGGATRSSDEVWETRWSKGVAECGVMSEANCLAGGAS